MRLQRLELRAYGPFTDKTLEFRENCGLHVLYGPNEAGKSSSLRAITDGLFGIPARTEDSFRHPNNKLRIGVGLRNQNGESLFAIRRKGNRGTLLQADEKKTFDESRWQAALGSIDREAFLRMFGIDHARLREGGRDIVDGKGDVGQSLFAAGTGLMHLHKSQARLQELVDDLFKSTGRSGTIKERIERYGDQKQKLKACSISVETWKSRRMELLNLEQQKEKLDQQMQHVHAELARWERMQTAHPLVRRWEEARSAWQELAGVPDLPETFQEDCRKAADQKQKHQEKLDETELELKRLETDLEKLTYSELLWQKKAEIEALSDELGGIVKAEKDCPGLSIEVQQLAEHQQDILRDLGHDPETTPLESLRITSQQELAIRDLATQQEGFEVKWDSLQKSTKQLRQDLEQLKGKLQHATATENFDNLKQLTRDAVSLGDVIAELQSLHTESEKKSKKLARQLERLPNWTGTAEELSQLKIPLPETIDSYQGKFQKHEKQFENAESDQHDFKEKQTNIAEAIEELELKGSVPDEGQLQEAREWRERGWQLVLDDWQQREVSAESLSDFLTHTQADDLASGFEQSLQTTDELADALCENAERVARKAQLQLEQAQTTRRIEDAQQRVAELEEAGQQLQREWEALWQATGVTPREPREMLKWHREYTSLVEAWGELSEQKQKLADQEAWIEDIRKKLIQELQQRGEPCDAATDFQQVREQAENLLGELQKKQTLRAEWTRTLPEKERDLQKAEQDFQEAEEKYAKWQAKWKQAMTGLGLAENAKPSLANHVLKKLDELFEKERDRNDKLNRIRAMQEYMKEYRQRVSQLLRELGDEQQELDPATGKPRPVNVLVKKLQQDWQNAEDVRVKQEATRGQIQELQRKVETATQAVQTQAERLAEFCRQAKCETPEELPGICEQAKEKRDLARTIQQVENDLRPQTAGQNLQEFAQEVLSAVVHIDQLPGIIAGLEDQLQVLKTRKDEIVGQVAVAQQALAQIDGQDVAARQAEECESLAAGLGNKIQQWASLTIASRMLQQAQEEYRKKHQGPILERASQLFARLTYDSFTGLLIDHDENEDRPVLFGRRASPEEAVKVTGMSDGTCDQLYLALRLASLETWIADHAPVPFIVDDILLNFDDTRAIAALQVLQEFSNTTQVLFFTHHQHLLELVEAQLQPDRVEILRLE